MTSIENAYADWLRARAVLAECDTDMLDKFPAKKGDEITTAALDALKDAEWKLLRTPARTLDDLCTRAEIVSEMFVQADKIGPPTDNRHRLMLSALVSEILAFEPSENALYRPEREADGIVRRLDLTGGRKHVAG